MNKFKTLLTLAFALTASTAWASEDDYYYRYTAPYLGDYSGEFDDQPGTLRLTQVGNEVRAEFFAADGSWDLVEGCGASFGRVVDADVDEKSGRYEIDKLVMVFNPGQCRQIRGREITLDFKHDDGQVSHVNLSVLEYTETRYDCWRTIGYPYDYGYPRYGRPGYPGYPYPDRCMPTSYSSYLRGSFYKL